MDILQYIKPIIDQGVVGILLVILGYAYYKLQQEFTAYRKQVEIDKQALNDRLITFAETLTTQYKDAIGKVSDSIDSMRSFIKQ